jgi:hypothetical protein
MKKKSAPKKKVVQKLPNTGQIPADVLRALLEAIGTGKYLFAVWSVSNERVNLFRTAMEFPKGDLDAALTLLQEQIAELKK